MIFLKELRKIKILRAIFVHHPIWTSLFFFSRNPLHSNIIIINLDSTFFSIFHEVDIKEPKKSVIFKFKNKYCFFDNVTSPSYPIRPQNFKIWKLWVTKSRALVIFGVDHWTPFKSMVQNCVPVDHFVAHKERNNKNVSLCWYLVSKWKHQT